jgi:hypothetical protein
MCEWGTWTVLRLTIPADLSHTGQDREKDCDIDSCIARIVRALNDGGVPTVACCCGHGKQPGRITLGDGRELLVAPDFDTATAVSQAFPPINDRRRVPRAAS